MSAPEYQDWITPAAALGMVAPFTDMPRTQLGNWIVNGHVRCLAMEVVRNLTAEPAHPKHLPQPDANGVVNIGRPIAVFDLPLSRSVEADYTMSAADWIAALQQGADEDAVWRSAELSHRVATGWNPNSTITYSGIRLSGADIERRMAIAGWAASGAQAGPKRRGRPEGTDAYPSDSALVSEIVKAIEGGMEFRDAAKMVAPKGERASNQVSDESVIKRLKPKVKRAAERAGIKFE